MPDRNTKSICIRLSNCAYFQDQFRKYGKSAPQSLKDEARMHLCAPGNYVSFKSSNKNLNGIDFFKTRSVVLTILLQQHLNNQQQFIHYLTMKQICRLAK